MMVCREERGANQSFHRVAVQGGGSSKTAGRLCLDGKKAKMVDRIFEEDQQESLL